MDITIQRAATGLLHCDIDVVGIDPLEAEQWAAAHCDGALLCIQALIRDGRVGTVWFGQLHFGTQPQAYARLELPLSNPGDGGEPSVRRKRAEQPPTMVLIQRIGGRNSQCGIGHAGNQNVSLGGWPWLRMLAEANRV